MKHGAELRPLPPGQIVARRFIRFGLGRFRHKVVDHKGPADFAISGRVANPGNVGEAFTALPRTTQVSDFHCVTGWSALDLRWRGVKFADFCREIAQPLPETGTVVFHASDGYRCAMELCDLLAGDVLLAEELDEQPLGLEHGSPLRLVAPSHYGYKSVKHIVRIEFRASRRGYRFPFPYPGLMDHPRARVALEERASLLPNWLMRPLYGCAGDSLRQMPDHRMAVHGIAPCTANAALRVLRLDNGGLHCAGSAAGALGSGPINLAGQNSGRRS